MKKIIIFSTFIIVIVLLGGILLYLNKDVVNYELGANDIAVVNGEYHIVGRAATENLLDKIEVFNNKGEKLDEFTLDEVTEDILLNSRFKLDMSFTASDFKGVKLTTEEEKGKDKLFYHFEHDGTLYKHKILPMGSQPNFFYWSKIHATIIE